MVTSSLPQLVEEKTYEPNVYLFVKKISYVQ